jgi:hypothetical protein
VLDDFQGRQAKYTNKIEEKNVFGKDERKPAGNRVKIFLKI